MTAEQFRRLALEFPDTIEFEHMGHPDFRANGKIFASLGYPGEGFGMVKLTPEQQRATMKQAPAVFSPSAGAWGRAGSTQVLLKRAKVRTVRATLTAAWRHRRPKAAVKAKPKASSRGRRK